MNHYETLGIAANAEDIVVRAAYRAMSQRYHPDRFVGDPTAARVQMSEINQAYSVLSDPERRRAYDEELKTSADAGLNASQKRSDIYAVKNSPPRHLKTLAILISALLIVAALWVELVRHPSKRNEPTVVLAERGDADSQVKMAWIELVPQDGTNSDIDKALMWFTKAADQGNLEAQYQLAELYLFSLSKRPDFELGMKWLVNAAEAGYEKAQDRLGTQYLYGPTKDATTAILWYRRAAEQGSKSAQLHLAIAYEALVPQDKVNAYAWMWLASDYGVLQLDRPNAGVREHGLKELEGRMSNAELAEAKTKIEQLRKTIKSVPK
jgi:TPR repeat protein